MKHLPQGGASQAEYYEITKDGSVMVNATEMAKPFDKRPAEWLRLPSTQAFMNELSNMGKSHISSVQTLRGSSENGGGTWMHKDVAKDFLRALPENRSLEDYELVASVRGDNNTDPRLR